MSLGPYSITPTTMSRSNKFFRRLRRNRIHDLARQQQQQLQESFKSPWAVVSLFQKILANHWYKVPVEFAPGSKHHHQLIYNDPRKNSRVARNQLLEFVFLFFYGIIIPFYVLLRNAFSPKDHPLYGTINWIHISLCLASIAGTVSIGGMAWNLKCYESEMVYWFNTLMDFKQRLHNGQIASSMTGFTAIWTCYHARKVIYAVYANTILQGFILIIPPMCACLLFFDCDPTYFIVEDLLFSWWAYQENNGNHHPHVKLLRIIGKFFRFLGNTFGGLLMGGRVLSFVLLLDCCRIWTYDYCITVMSTTTCPFALHKIYSQLRLCHSVLGRFYDKVYCIFMGFSQIIIVLDWWISFVTIGKIPFIVWSMFPIMAAETAIGAFLYMRMAQHVHETSESLLLRPLQLQLKKKGNTLLRLKWQSVKPLEMQCGIFFTIKRQSLLTSLHLVMNNLGTFIIINELKEKVRLW